MYVHLFSKYFNDGFSECKDLDELDQSKILMVALTAFVCLAAYYFPDAYSRKPLYWQGKKILQNGTVHEGIFYKDQLQYGTKTYRNGEVLKGFFQNNLLHGQGKRIYPSKIEEEGEFEEGWLKEGKKIYPDGTTKKYELKLPLFQ